MAVRIYTDSASDIVGEIDPLVRVVPLRVSFGDDEYHDGVDLSHERFYELLVESDELPKTSQATPYELGKIFGEAVDAGDEVVMVTLSAELSGTYQSAVTAAAEFDGKVFVVDSRTVCVAQRILVELGLRLAHEGLSAREIAQELNRRREDVRIVALLDTLEYLRRGERISAATSVLGEMLSIKPVVGVEDGVVKLLGKARGSRNGNNFLNQEVEQSGGIDFSMPFALGYTGLSDKLLRKYVEDSRSLWEHKVDELPIHTIGVAIGTHVGPNAIALAYFRGRD